MNALEALSDHRAHAQKSRTLCRPVARRAAAIHLARKNDASNARLLIIHRRSEQGVLTALQEVEGPTALLILRQQVAKLHIRECATHHDLVISATRAVRVEIRLGDATFTQVIGRRGIKRDSTCWRNMVGRDEIAQLGQHARTRNRGDRIKRADFTLHAVEIRCAAHIRRRIVPVKRRSLPRIKGIPRRITVEHPHRPLVEQVVVDETRH